MLLDTGMVNTATDPNLNKTTYSYSGTFVGGYVTETQLPTTTDAGGTQHYLSGERLDWDRGRLRNLHL